MPTIYCILHHNTYHSVTPSAQFNFLHIKLTHWMCLWFESTTNLRSQRKRPKKKKRSRKMFSLSLSLRRVMWLVDKSNYYINTVLIKISVKWQVLHGEIVSPDFCSAWRKQKSNSYALCPNIQDSFPAISTVQFCFFSICTIDWFSRRWCTNGLEAREVYERERVTERIKRSF